MIGYDTIFGKKRGLILSTAVLAFGIVGAAVWFLHTEPTGVADPTDERQVALGRRLYSENCAACHGAKLEGQPNWRIRKPDGRLPAPPHDENGHTWHHPDAHLFRITRDGLLPPLAPDGYKSDMLPFGNILSDAEIWAVLAFIKSTWPAKIRARQKSITERTQQ